MSPAEKVRMRELLHLLWGKGAGDVKTYDKKQWSELARLVDKSVGPL